MNISKLIDRLAQLNLECGEVIGGSHAAEFIQEFEFEHGVEFSAIEVMKALRMAGESFVDSMQQNECDTEEAVKDGLYGGYPIDPLESRIAGWESMRPSVIRKNQLIDMINEFN